MKNIYCFFALIALLALSSCEKELIETQYITPADAQLTEIELAQLDYQLTALEECIKGDWDKFWEDKDKEDWDKEDKEEENSEESSGECGNDRDTVMPECGMFSDEDKDKGVKKYIIKPIVKSDDCGCIVAGLIKYVEKGRTTALVDYGDGTCDAWVVKISFDDKGDKETATVCKYEMGCSKEVEEVEDGE